MFKPNSKHALAVVATNITIEESPKKAFKSPEWHVAMKAEFDTKIKNKTWTLVPRARDDNMVNIFGCLKSISM